MKTNKKGFTLVELLAVILVLIIIILIAINRVRKLIDDSADNALVANAETFIKGANGVLSVSSAGGDDHSEEILSLSDFRDLGLSISGDLPDYASFLVDDYNEVLEGCLTYGDYSFEYHNKKLSDPFKGNCGSASSVTFDYKPSAQMFEINLSRNYKIEAWGAEGNDPDKDRARGGKGAYTSGIIYLEKGTVLYIYTGEHRNDRTSSFNCGSTGGSGVGSSDYGAGPNGFGGGGATDIRLEGGSWDSVTGLRSRIMVAAGGGGANDYDYSAHGGAGGTLIGISGQNGRYPDRGVAHIVPTGGTQISGGLTTGGSVNKGTNGSFGKGGNGHSSWGSGGGGGYFGGGGGGFTDYSVDSGAGGSSYISGHTGCVAVKSSSSDDLKDGCTTGTDDNSCSVHYSNYKFKSTLMLSGEDEMPLPYGDGTEIGHSGSGVVKISSAY